MNHLGRQRHRLVLLLQFLLLLTDRRVALFLSQRSCRKSGSNLGRWTSRVHPLVAGRSLLPIQARRRFASALVLSGLIAAVSSTTRTLAGPFLLPLGNALSR